MRKETPWILAVVCASPAALAACGPASVAATQAPRLPRVEVATVQSERVTLTTELPGRTSPYLVAEIRPQVNGIIQQRAFREGSDVQAGQLLYEIDPAPYRAALAQYERAIQQAFREVSDALTLRTRLAEQRAAEVSLVAALLETERLSDARYKAGMDSYLQVLVADRSLFAGQQALVGVRLAEQVNLVTLYKVLGGGA